MESEPLDGRTKWYGEMLVSQISSDAVMNKLVSEYPFVNNMVSGRASFNSLMNESFETHSKTYP
jgi:hypothetical protein